MSTEQSRTDTTNRERAPDEQYTLPVEAAADKYAAAGHPRTIRAIQKYCALEKLDCRKVDTETGEKYLIAPYSVTRHIAYIDEVRTVTIGREQPRPNTNDRGQSRTDATVHQLEKDDATPRPQSPQSDEQPRTVGAVRGADNRYVTKLESENDFLRTQLLVKDTQIKELTERARETNVLIAGLQKMLTPLLGGGAEPRQ